MPPETMPCPTCASENSSFHADARDTEYCTTDHVYTYLQCEDCQTVFLVSPPVDQLALIYPPSYYSYQADADGHSLLQGLKSILDGRMFKHLLSQIPGEKLSVLEVGGGSGWLLTQIRKLSTRVTETHVVDIDAGAQAAAERAGHSFHRARVEEFAASHSFDLILMLNLIEHVADPRHVLQAMERVLSPNGLILIKTPNTATWDRRLFQHRNWGGFHCPRHFVLFTKANFINLAEQCGLDCVEATYTQGAPQWTTSVLGWMSGRGWITVTGEKPMYRHLLYGPLLALFAGLDFIRKPFCPTAQMLITLKKRGSTS
jgi:SAM-dependent methyltransferase